MKALKDSLEYTKEMMSHKMQTMKSLFEESAFYDIKEYLYNGGDDTLVGSSLGRLSNWNLWCYLDEFLNKQKNTLDLLVKSVFYGIWANKWEYVLGLIYKPYDEAVLFKNSSAHLALLVFLGYYGEATNYSNLLNSMLNNKQLSSFSDYPLYPWFIFDLYMRSQGEIISGKWNKPKQILYEEVLKNWNNPDSIQTDKLIVQMCEMHIRESDEYTQTSSSINDDSFIHTDSESREFLEFSSADYFIFPIEILMWLKIRKNNGLYIKNDIHPLLMLDINQMPTQNLVVPAMDNLLKECISKLQKDNPEIKFNFN